HGPRGRCSGRARVAPRAASHGPDDRPTAPRPACAWAPCRRPGSSVRSRGAVRPSLLPRARSSRIRPSGPAGVARGDPNEPPDVCLRILVPSQTMVGSVVEPRKPASDHERSALHRALGLDLPSLLEGLDVGVIVEGREAEILYANRLALSLLGLRREQVMGGTSFD